MDVEKTQSPSVEPVQINEANSDMIDLNQRGGRDGYILDADRLDDDKVYKLAKDGRTVLIPQPSDDPNDPLNWSTTKKHVILFIVSLCAFLPDYGSATGAVTLIPQAA